MLYLLINFYIQFFVKITDGGRLVIFLILVTAVLYTRKKMVFIDLLA